MQFGLNKCATTRIKSGKLVEMERKTLVEGNNMSALKEDGECKCIEILEVNDFKHEKIGGIAKTK